MTEITDEQVERAAKALYEASLDGPRNQLRLSWNDCPSRDYFMEQARIALEAAQDPEPFERLIAALADVNARRSSARLHNERAHDDGS